MLRRILPLAVAVMIALPALSSAAQAKDPWKHYWKAEQKREKAYYKHQRKQAKEWNKYHRKQAKAYERYHGW